MSKLKVLVLGPGCANCEKLFEWTKAAVEKAGVDAEVEYVKELDRISNYVMMTPGLVINEKVAHQGKPLPKVDKIVALLQKA